jgi:O-antigen/teichoic acid export membrane protein
MSDNTVKSLRLKSLKSRIIFLIKDVSLYGFAMSATKMLGIFTVPILARIFSKTEFGVIDAITIISAVFAPIIVMGQDSAIARFYYETEDSLQRRTIISQGGIIELIIASIILSLLCGTASQISNFYFNTDKYASIVVLSAFGMFMNVSVRYPQNVLKWTYRRKLFLILSIGMPTSVVALTYLFVVVMKLGIEGVFFAQIVSGIIFTILGVYFIRSQLVAKFNQNYYTQLFKYGWPFTLPPIFTAIIPSMDRYFIMQYTDAGASALGVYAFAHKIARLLSFPIQGFQTAWGPFYLAVYKEKDVSKSYNAVLYLYTLALMIIICIVLLFADKIILVFGTEKYLPSKQYILPLLFSLALTSLSWITGVGIGLSKRTIYSALTYFLSMLTALVCLYYLVPRFGVMGASLSMLASASMVYIANSLFGRVLYSNIRINFLPPFLFILLSFFLLSSYNG